MRHITQVNSHIRAPEYMVQLSTVDEDRCVECGGSGFIPVPSTNPYFAGVSEPVYDLAPCPCCQESPCQVCGGVGLVGTGAKYGQPGFGQLVPCPANCATVQATYEKRGGRIRKYARIPIEYKDCSFEKFDAYASDVRDGKMAGRWGAHYFVEGAEDGFYVDRRDIAFQFQLDKPSDRRNWLVFYGETGRGKTGMAAAIANALMEQGYAPMYIRLQDFFMAVQKRYTKRDQYNDDFGDDASSDDVIDEVCSAAILIIDEADVSDLRDNKEALFEKLIRHRHGYRLPTILTTNLDKDSFERRWDKKIASIVRGNAHWLPMRGVAIRGDVGEFEWE